MGDTRVGVGVGGWVQGVRVQGFRVCGFGVSHDLFYRYCFEERLAFRV